MQNYVCLRELGATLDILKGNYLHLKYVEYVLFLCEFWKNILLTLYEC